MDYCVFSDFYNDLNQEKVNIVEVISIHKHTEEISNSLMASPPNNIFGYYL